MLIYCDCWNCGAVTEPVAYDWETGEYIPPAGWTIYEDAYKNYYCPQCSEYVYDGEEIRCICELDENEEQET